MNDDLTPVEVPAWVVLAAIRYGLPRRTYAHTESLELIAQHAHLLAGQGWLDTIVDDLTLFCGRQACRPDHSHAQAQQAIANAHLDTREASDG